MIVLISKNSISYHKPDCSVVSIEPYAENGLVYPFFPLGLSDVLKIHRRGGRDPDYRPCPKCFPAQFSQHEYCQEVK